MTDQVSNALNILSYFSTLLDPIATSTANQKYSGELNSSNCNNTLVETPPPSTSAPSSSSSSSSSPSSSSSSSSSEPKVSLNLANLTNSSDNLRPLLIGLKLPISLTSSNCFSPGISCANLLATANSSIDHQTFFLINPVFTPGTSNGSKSGSVTLSHTCAPIVTNGGGQPNLNESDWTIRSNSAPLICSTQQSLADVKSEALLIGRNGSERDGSADSSPTRRESGDDTNFQFPCSALSFSLPFSPSNDSKQYFDSETLQQRSFNSPGLTGSDSRLKLAQSPDPMFIGISGMTFNNLQSGSGNVCLGNTGVDGKEEKICAVCGDRALGCNFGAVSCESCKAFFRRNAFKDQKIKCLFDGNCQINVNTRRFCSLCRLKHCTAVGMKKHLILGIEEKRRRMEVVKQNRKRRIVEGVSSTTTTTTTNSTTVATNINTSADILHSENTNLLTLARLDPVMSTSSASSASQSIDSQLVRKLTAEESHMLIDLNQVYDLSFTVDLEPLIHITQLNPSLNQLINQSSYTVLRLIKFAKRLDDFVKLSQDLQISILKGCWFHLLLLRPVSLFDAERDGWITPKGVIPTDILKNATGYVQLHDDHLRYCRSIKSIIGNDIMLLVILLVLVLFAPDGPHVVAREVISNIQDRYVILLKHYLEAKYTFKRSAHMFPQLLEKIRELNSLVDNHAKILMDINPQEIEPIMLEMLDFKS